MASDSRCQQTQSKASKNSNYPHPQFLSVQPLVEEVCKDVELYQYTYRPQRTIRTAASISSQAVWSPELEYRALRDGEHSELRVVDRLVIKHQQYNQFHQNGKPELWIDAPEPLLQVLAITARPAHRPPYQETTHREEYRNSTEKSYKIVKHRYGTYLQMGQHVSIQHFDCRQKADGIEAVCILPPPVITL